MLLRPDIEDHLVIGDPGHVDHARGRMRFELSRHHRVHRQQDFAIVRFGLGEDFLRGRDEVTLNQGFPDARLLSASKNVFAMAPPMISTSTFLSRLPSRSSLVEIFAPPTMAATGRCGCSSAFSSASSSACMARPA